MQSAMGGSKDMNMTVYAVGPDLDRRRTRPATADYARFYKAAVEKGWIFSDPRGAKAQPGQAKAMAEMYRQMADIGGNPVRDQRADQDERQRSHGRDAGEDGWRRLDDGVDSVETGALADDLFVPPAGYKLQAK